MVYKILNFCSDLLDFDGTRGDIIYLEQRLKDHHIKYTIHQHQTGKVVDFMEYDFVYMGVCPQKYEMLFLKILHQYREAIECYIESGKVLLAIEQSFLFLGEAQDKSAAYLNILPLVVATHETYTIGNILLDTELKTKQQKAFCSKINGFFNSRYRYTFKPMEEEKLRHFEVLGNILLGQGFLWEQGSEGMRWRNFFGTQLRGPIFPRNYDFCDFIIALIIGKELQGKYISTIDRLAKEKLTEACFAFIESDEQKKEYIYVS